MYCVQLATFYFTSLVKMRGYLFTSWKETTTLNQCHQEVSFQNVSDNTVCWKSIVTHKRWMPLLRIRSRFELFYQIRLFYHVKDVIQKFKYLFINAVRLKKTVFEFQLYCICRMIPATGIACYWYCTAMGQGSRPTVVKE